MPATRRPPLSDLSAVCRQIRQSQRRRDQRRRVARSGLVDVGALDQEGDAHVRAEFVQVLPSDPRADDVDGPDVAKRCLRLLQRLLRRVVGGRLRASNQLDDLDNRHSLLLSVWLKRTETTAAVGLFYPVRGPQATVG